MTLKLIILTVLGAVVLTILAEMIVRAWRYRRNRPDEAPFASRLLLLLLLLAPSGAWAQSGWTVENRSGSTFTVSRTNTSVAETVRYRTVNISAYAGQHYTAATGTLTFGVGDDSKTVTVEESNPDNNAYSYQTGTQRSYRFEVTDLGGFHLAHCDRVRTYGTQFNAAKVNKSVTNLVLMINNGNFSNGNFSSGMNSNKYLDVSFTPPTNYVETSGTLAGYVSIDDSYDYARKPATVSTSDLINSTGASASYLNTLNYKIYATVCFTEKEKNDGYQYIQIVAGDSNAAYDAGADPNGAVNAPSNSIYKVCFELSNNSNAQGKAYFPHRGTSTIADEFGLSSGKLHQQKYKRGTSGSGTGCVVLDPTVPSITTRFDAGGDLNDTWGYKDLFVRMTLVDNAAPTKLDVTVNPGKHCKGNTVYVTVAFNEIVTVNGALTLSTSWGTLNYLDGSGSNVLTFSGTIPENASSSLTVTGLNINVNNNITVKDLAGNNFTWSGNNTLDRSLESSYAWPISYNLDGGTASNPATYTWETATFTLTNPTREGYTFDGWTGSNGNTPQSTVTIANHTHAPLSYTAHWTPITYNLTYDLDGGSVATANPDTYTIETATFTLTNPTREGYTFDGWTGGVNSELSTPTSELTIAQGSTGHRSYTANWTPITYNISYDLDGGSVTTPNPDTYTVETPEFTLNTPTREGYTFAGWTGTGLAAATQTVTIAQGSIGDRSYTATWNNLWGVDADHDGTTAERAYIITTPEGLELLASQVNSGNPFSGTFFKLGANIDLDGYSIPPIGDYSQSRPFQGSLDGDNYTITNMSLTGGDCQGLFGYLAGGRVENLTVSNATLSGNGDYRGVVCGYNLGGTLQNCQVTGSSLADSGQYVGGVVGGTFGDAVVSECQCTSTTIDITGDFVGGVAGIAANTTIVNCTNSAAVGGINQVGGIVGLLGPDAQLEGCTNSGLVRGIAQVGGLVGYQRAGSGQCSGSNSGNVRWSAMGGGVCGYAEDTTMLEGCSSVSILPYDTIIRIQSVEELGLIRDNVNNGSNSYEGKVIVLDWNLNLGNGWTPIGTPEYPFRGTFDGQDHTINFGIYNESNDYQGFFGYMQGTVKNVNFTQCSVIGRNYVGVIAGYCNGTISNCYSYREKVEGEKYVGGLVGMASYSEIQDCFNGNNIVGVQYVGGIVGDFADHSTLNTNHSTLTTDLYSGNVSRCYNYGMVRATGDTSHVGGIAGYTSAEVRHCYNSGIVDGKDFVGGLCGQLDGDNLHHCYNAGHVSATGNNKGAVCGSLNLQDIIYNCFYDRQMCTVQDANASGYNTLKMTGTALQNVFGTDYWSYNDNEYPTLKTTKKDSTYFRISVKPLLLPGNMPVDKVVQPFCGVTGNAPYSHVEWSRYGTATPIVDTIHLADKDSITLLGCGVDTLMVSHPGYGFERLVPIVVAAREATVETVHTCSSIYKWNKNNQFYNETGFYTYGDNCDNKQALDLTITPVTLTTSTSINSTCETTPDGEVLVSVSGGGPGNGFRYLWINSLTEDSIGNTPTLTDIPAGYYSVTVTDSLYSTCSQTSPITLTAVAPVALTIKSCDASKTYDGTALTGNRYVVTEQDFEPDTLPADSFAILVNGDTLRVTFDSNAVNAGTYENIFTYSISNGIDHSCHYNVDTIFGTLSITPRPATIIVNDTSKTYGDTDPVFSGTVTGLVNSDSLGTIHYFRNDNSENVGNYPDILTASCTTPNPNYEVSIDKGDLIIYCRDLLIRTDNWPDDIENRNECYSPSNTDALPSADSIKNLILANNDTLQPDAFQVLTKDSTILANNCDWKWARTYTVKISNPNFCDSTSRVIYVSGGDQTAPVRSINDLWTYGTLPQDACLASFNIDLFFPKDQDLFDDCSQMTITHKDTNTGDDHYGWTIRRSYVVTDACGHTIYDTIEVSGRDMTPPVAAHDTLWSALATNLSDSILVIHDIAQLKTLFGLSDECTGNDISLVSSSKTLKTGEHCDYTVIIAYVVADAYGNSTTIYHAQFIQDTIGPTFEIVPHDTTLCVDPDGNYENTVTRVAAEITVTNLHSNCTSLQESFRVQSSMDTSRFDFYHPRGYRITQGESDNGVRHYKQLWTVIDSCGNTTYDSISIHVRPLPKITQITNPDQHIIYGNPITEVWIYHQYSDLSITGLSGIGLDSLGCSVEHKKDPNNNEYDRVYGDPEFAVTNATFLVTANSHLGWGCSIDSSTFSITVEPRPIVITATNATKKYDGTPLTSTDYTCTTDEGSPDDALVHDDVISRLSFSGSQTNVGSSTNTIGNAKITAPNDTTIDKTSNYSIDYYNGTLTVTANDTAITVTAGSGSRFYDGTPFTLAAHDDFIVTGVPDALTWTATADGTVTNIIPGEGEKPLNEVTSFHIFDADGNDVTEYFTNITYQSGTLAVNPVAVTPGDGWQAISTPVHDEGKTYWTVSSVFTTAPYDLFRYDEPTATWQNYKTHSFTLSPARGYIYRTVTDEALIYDGMPNSEASYSIALTAGAPNDLAGWNLVGNPYPFPVHLDCPYYSLLPDGRWEAHDAPVATDSLDMGQAVLVHTTAPATLTFYYATRSTNAPAQAKGPLPALPRGLCLSGDCDRNDAMTQSHNQDFAHWDNGQLIVEGEGTLEAYDVMGRRLFNVEIRNSKFEIQNSVFPSVGVYLLRLAGQSQKIVITK